MEMSDTEAMLARITERTVASVGAATTAQAKAWGGLSSRATLAREEFQALPANVRRTLTNLECLLGYIERQKRDIDRLIDSLPE